ncbi:carbon-nitrogen hydrolase family protein [Clostridium perfringens]|nr:carbon-nitrogen hydrolase family protein [Clostridium perfringens]
MKIGLASKEFVNGDIDQNILTIIETMKEAKKNNAEMICFGEAFLQGFDSLCWKYNRDKEIALKISSLPIQNICNYAKKIEIGVSFGYIENDEDLLYCSYVVINENGKIIHNFKRVSPGWKESCADNNYYKESNSFSTFKYKDLTFSVGLCGDFWYEDNVKKVSELKKDLTLWPLFVDFTIEEFESKYKKEYAEQASKLESKVLFINSISKETPAFGGCIEFSNGNILNELPIGTEGILYIEI